MAHRFRRPRLRWPMPDAGLHSSARRGQPDRRVRRFPDRLAAPRPGSHVALPTSSIAGRALRSTRAISAAISKPAHSSAPLAIRSGSKPCCTSRDRKSSWLRWGGDYAFDWITDQAKFSGALSAISQNATWTTCRAARRGRRRAHAPMPKELTPTRHLVSGPRPVRPRPTAPDPGIHGGARISVAPSPLLALTRWIRQTFSQ